MKIRLLLGVVAVGYSYYKVRSYLHKKKPLTTFYIVKDAPYYDAVGGEKCGQLKAFVAGQQQQVQIKHIFDKKWAQLASGDWIKLSYLQLNMNGVDRLMANDDVVVYASPSKESKQIAVLKRGSVVSVETFTSDRHFAYIQTASFKGYVPFTYMKY